jgi:uncharacterized protein DUF5681
MKLKSPLGLKDRLSAAKSAEERQQILDGLPHEVGFGKPPRNTRFKPGRSTNPKGRPKGSKNVMTILRKEVDEKIEFVEDGKRKKLTKMELATRQQVNKAVKGDTKAYAHVFDALRKEEARSEQYAAPPAQPDSRDLEAMNNMVEFYKSAELAGISDDGSDSQ